MSTNLEIEFKSELSSLDYEKLIASFPNQKIYAQNNFYLDTDSLEIRKQKCGLRLRKKEDEYELTIKVPQEVGKLEINQQISNKKADSLIKNNVIPDGEIKDFIESNLHIKPSKIKVLGNLLTYRLDIKYESSLISIDKSIYNDIIDYEIECEDINKKSAKKNLKNFLDENGLEYKKSPGSKLKRFLKSLGY